MMALCPRVVWVCLESADACHCVGRDIFGLMQRMFAHELATSRRIDALAWAKRPLQFRLK